MFRLKYLSAALVVDGLTVTSTVLLVCPAVNSSVPRVAV